MTIDDLIANAQADGLTLTVDDDDIVVTAPTWDALHVWTPCLKAHKLALMQRLNACPACGATAWRKTPDGGRWCEPCVIAGRVPVLAVKVWSAVLDAPLWVVAGDLPRDQWPQDAPVYRCAEVMALRHCPPHVLRWAHAAKQELGARVIDAKGSQHDVA